MLTREEAVARWLTGTTCRPRCRPSALWDDSEFILLHHRSHSSYVDRMVGVKTCEGYVALFRMDGVRLDSFMGDWHGLRLWEGRWNRAKLAEAMAYVAALRKGHT